METLLLVASTMLLSAAGESIDTSLVGPRAAQDVVLIQMRTTARRDASGDGVVPPLRDSLSTWEADYIDDADSGVDPEPEKSMPENSGVDSTGPPNSTADDNASIINMSIQEAIAANASDANISAHDYLASDNRSADVFPNGTINGSAARLNQTQQTVLQGINGTASDPGDFGSNHTVAGNSTESGSRRPGIWNGTLHANGTDVYDADFMSDDQANTSNYTANSTTVFDTDAHVNASNASASGEFAGNSSSDPTRCSTRADPRAHSYMTRVSPAGTPCTFGVDDRDEGFHCIMDDGKYGSYGWCFTSNDTSSWGSCNQHCPLFGAAKILADKIEALERKLAAKGFTNMIAKAKGMSVPESLVTGLE